MAGNIKRDSANCVLCPMFDMLPICCILTNCDVRLFEKVVNNSVICQCDYTYFIGNRTR